MLSPPPSASGEPQLSASANGDRHGACRRRRDRTRSRAATAARWCAATAARRRFRLYHCDTATRAPRLRTNCYRSSCRQTTVLQCAARSAVCSSRGDCQARRILSGDRLRRLDDCPPRARRCRRSCGHACKRRSYEPFCCLPAYTCAEGRRVVPVRSWTYTMDF